MSQKMERAVSSNEVPLVPDVIDFQSITPQDDESVVHQEQQLAMDVRAAAEKYGVFMVKNHGIDKKLMKELKEALHELFLLPAEEHSVLTMPPSAETDRLMYGYTEVFGERVYSLAGRADKPPDPAQKFSIAKAKGVDISFNPKNLWPLACQVEKYPRLAKLRPLFEEYFRQCTQLAIRVGRLLAIALELDPALFDDFDAHLCSLRGLCYPKHSGPASQLRMAPHTDVGVFTLLPADPTEALEYFTNERWQRLAYVEDTFLVHIGDAVSVLTNGQWPSQLHRVSRPTEEDREQLVYFVNCDGNTLMKPAPRYMKQGDQQGEAESQSASDKPLNFEDWFMSKIPDAFLVDGQKKQ